MPACEAVLVECFLDQLPARLIGDKAYDSDELDEKMSACGVEMIAPHRSNRKQITQDKRIRPSNALCSCAVFSVALEL